MPNNSGGSSGSFFSVINKNALAVNQTASGAGVTGLVGFAALLLVASIFFVTENYFISMFTISVGLMVYVTGADLPKMLLSSVTIFFSSKHLIAKAVYLQSTLIAIQEILKLQRDSKGNIKTGTLPVGIQVTLPDNPLVQDLRRALDEGKDMEYAEYLAHSYYVECHELYDYSSGNLDFVGSSMPLFGLIGTIVGLIAMFDSLGADVTVETLSPQLALALKTTLYGAIFSSIYKIIGSRFDQRMRSLDYDYDTFCRALQVMVENKIRIEVQS